MDHAMAAQHIAGRGVQMRSIETRSAAIEPIIFDVERHRDFLETDSIDGSLGAFNRALVVSVVGNIYRVD
jgi:hypothetical protein